MSTVSGSGKILIPESSGIKADAQKETMSTHLLIFMPSQRISPYVGPPSSGSFLETPGSLACIYGLAPASAGCNPNTALKVATGGSKAIAIVDAYHNPTIAADFIAYSKQFGLPQTGLTVVYATNSGQQTTLKPPVDGSGGWGLESALDVEIAHAMAPGAKIYLVEATSASSAALLGAEDLASSLVAAAGGGEVSNSWGGSEFSSQASYDTHFQKSGVVYFASTGDSPGVNWPSTSANVVAVGGTTTSRDPETGSFLYETSWSEAGGGKSHVTQRPSYQASVVPVVGNARGVPDMSFDANPNTPVWVYYSGEVSGQSGGWWGVGGTSVAAPAIAGIVNAAGHFRASSAAELAQIYSGLGNTAAFDDVTIGNCGPYGGYVAKTAWDFCTSIGSPRGYTIK